VAQRLDITEEWVRDLIARKEIKAVKVGEWKIKPEDLEDFIKNRRNFASIFTGKLVIKSATGLSFFLVSYNLTFHIRYNREGHFSVS